MTTTSMAASAVLANGLAALEFSRQALIGFAEDIPPDQRAWAPIEGGNHLLWQLGHMAWTDDYFLAQLGGQPSKLDEAWTKRFGMGSTPTADASAYPAYEELCSALEERRAALIRWLQGLSEEQLAAPLPESYQDFAPNFGAMISTMAAHECMHVGQITVIRKGLGLKPKLG